MADKTVFVTGSVNAGQSSTTDSSPIPSGHTWVLEKVGFASQISGLVLTVMDVRSDTLQLLWGTPGNFETIRVIALTGNTIELSMKRSFEGDGSKFFRLIRTNNSGTARTSAAWAVAYEA